MHEKEYFFRPYIQSDVPFIQNSWAQSYYGGDGFKEHINPLEFNTYHRPFREEFLKRPTAAVIICCSKEDPDLIIGWIALEKKKTGIYMHYIYVKHTFQREGIGKELFNHVKDIRPVYMTHLTLKADRIIDCHKSLFKEFYYEPIKSLEQLRGKSENRRETSQIHPVPNKSTNRPQSA